MFVPSVTSCDVQEGASLGMLEEMACGKVVVCSNNGCIAKVVKDGIDGFWLKKIPWSPLVRNGCIYKEILE